MEELNVVGLSQRKESTVHLTVSELSPLRPTAEDSDLRVPIDNYPFACVLRLRVLQIVCGISALVMGSVAFIEERRETNLGLGVPAGGATVLAAAASIHQWRGKWRGGVSTSRWAAVVRSSGPAPLAALWAAACTLHLALLVQSIRTIFHTHIMSTSTSTDASNSSLHIEGGDSLDLPDQFHDASPRDLTVLACVQIVLTCATLACVFALAKVEWTAA